MRSNYYSTYDDLVDPTLFNGYEYVDVINSFQTSINRNKGNKKTLFKLNLSLSDTYLSACRLRFNILAFMGSVAGIL